MYDISRSPEIVCPATVVSALVNTGDRYFFSVFLKKSMVRCHASVAAALS
jgi:hypothetical protein